MRLGVIGTMVWDTIYGWDESIEPVQEWGGIAYALAALEAALPPDWRMVPVIKVGRDLAARADAFLAHLTKRSAATRFVGTLRPNNRVTLRYDSEGRRTECMTGGVPPWTWAELDPLVRDLDAIYVNFISGFELDLDTARALRDNFTGPLYVDLHSLFLGIGGDGMRSPRRLPDVEEWFACFDAVQLNQDELALIASDPMEVAATASARGVGLLVVTLGPRGAVYFAAEPFDFLSRKRAPNAAPIRTARLEPPHVDEPRDPTGCGDVFGATLIAGLIAGAGVPDAVKSANEAAARNLSYRGASGLQYHLRREIVPR
ncbi:MAG: carbohydrate kinase family protein [Gemmatimonadales bacterium]